MVVLDVAVVNVALPSIQQDLGKTRRTYRGDSLRNSSSTGTSASAAGRWP